MLIDESIESLIESLKESDLTHNVEVIKEPGALYISLSKNNHYATNRTVKIRLTDDVVLCAEEYNLTASSEEAAKILVAGINDMIKMFLRDNILAKRKLTGQELVDAILDSYIDIIEAPTEYGMTVNIRVNYKALQELIDSKTR